MSLAIRPTMSAQYNSVRNAQPKASAKAAAIVNSATSAKASDAEETWTEKWDEYMASLPVVPNKLEEERAEEEYRRTHLQPYTGPRTQTDYKENEDLKQAFWWVEDTADDMKDMANMIATIQSRENMAQDPNASEFDRSTSEIVLPYEKNYYQKNMEWLAGKEQEDSWLDDFVQKYNTSIQPDETKESDDALQAARNFLQGILGDVNSDSLGLSGLSDMSADQAKEALNRAADVLYHKLDQIGTAYQNRTGQSPDIYYGLGEREPMNEENLIGGIELQRWLDHQPPLFDGVHNGLIKMQQELKEVDPDTLTDGAKQALSTLNQMVLDFYA